MSVSVADSCSVQLLSRVRLFATPWITARQASLSITNSQSLLRVASIESVMPSSHLILFRPLLPPSNFPSIRVFSNESILPIRWPKYWSFSFSISPSNEHPLLSCKQVYQYHLFIFHIYAIIYDICFSLSDLLYIKGFRFVYLIVTDSNAFLFMVTSYSIVYMYYSFFIHLSINENLGCFHCK